jgi:hypothetical protein
MKFNFKNFLSFEKMITPVIIKILFYIGLVGSAIGGIVVFVTSFATGIGRGGFGNVVGGFLLGIILGILAIALGVLFTRIYCELLILFFRINETLSDIKQLLKEKFE